ncbi:hypothetical protein BDV34DRAFT_37331 [Aspergillus parasiticus]|uniref:Uncharacterized protein n=1 Tax=Aspergillus parasiticus TaxID=5067 RepID=A0A5N6DXE2_ASPPA|nr:hypothetical protein BDV34DRAFT_37331 [Aspergillus parasiticus]
MAYRIWCLVFFRLFGGWCLSFFYPFVSCENIFSPYFAWGKDWPGFLFICLYCCLHTPKAFIDIVGLATWFRHAVSISCLSFAVFLFTHCFDTKCASREVCYRSFYIYTYMHCLPNVFCSLSTAFCFLLSHPVITTSDTLHKHLPLASHFSLSSLILLACRSLHLT